jgi:lipopolysaccharide export system permease protein
MPKFRFNVPILYRYVFGEIFTPFAISLSIFTSILFLIRSLKLIDLVVSKNVPASEMLLLFSYIIPRFFEIALPMSCFLGIILAFSKLSSSSELVVMRATGIGLHRLISPVLFFAFLMFCLSLLMSTLVTPWANYRLGRGMFEIAKTKISSGLVPGVFNEMGQLTVYAEQIEGQGQKLKNVIIADRLDEKSIKNFISKHGKIVADDKKRNLSIQLIDGSIHEGRAKNYNLTFFDLNNILINHYQILTNDGMDERGKRSNEMHFGELSENITLIKNKSSTLNKEEAKQLASYQVENQRRWIIPIACICIAIIGMALGIQSSRLAESWGTTISIMVGILVVVAYYLLMALTTALAEQGWKPTNLIVWAPNILFSILTIILIRRIANEKWLTISQTLANLFSVFSKLKKSKV